MSYRVSTQVYSGPFDLLLQLVTRQKVDIGAISISEVAEQYLAEAERIEALDLDVASDFLLVAATLLDIKAASLVPQEAPRKTDDDDEDDDELEELSALDGDALREVLIQRLIAYKQFKGAAAALGARMQAESRMHPRVAGPDPEFLGLMPDYLAGITLRGLAVICADLVAEVAVARDVLGTAPLLLLDDVMSELDGERRGAFLRLIGDDIQTVITTTNLGYFTDDLLDRAKVVSMGETC